MFMTFWLFVSSFIFHIFTYVCVRCMVDSPGFLNDLGCLIPPLISVTDQC